MRQARQQLPRASEGIIVLDLEHPESFVPMAEEKLRSPACSHVIGMLLTGRGAWFCPNTLYSSFPVDIARIALEVPRLSQGDSHTKELTDGVTR